MKCYVCHHSSKLPNERCLEGGSLGLLVDCPPASRYNIRFDRCFVGYTNDTSSSFYIFERKCGRMIPYSLGCSRNLVSKFKTVCSCVGEGCNGESYLPSSENSSDNLLPFSTVTSLTGFLLLPAFVSAITRLQM